jgi:superfamily II DNA or RNA helicase
MKRKHQIEFEKIIDEIISGKPIKKILVSATPGAGKSSIPIIASKLIAAKKVHAISWIVPRSSLQDQGERAFLDPFFRKMFNHTYQIRSSTNDKLPCRGTSGFITTFQAIAADKRNTVLNDFKYRKYALILDEFHHLDEYGTWENSINPLVKYAKYIILMTGTLERNTGSKIAFIDYVNSLPSLENKNDTKVIRYTRKDALQEKAILPIKFNFCDAKLAWQTNAGLLIKINSFKKAKTKKDAGAAIYTALNSNFATELLTKSLKHWQQHKKWNKTSKFLVVTDGIENARKINNLLKIWGFNCRMATSHNPIDAVKAIKEFKKNLDLLITIAMAYEGMDVPEISHVCCLTHIRSKPWIEQMIARGVRINKKAGPYSRQTCYVFAPADIKFLKIAEQIEKEQINAIKFQAKPAEQIEMFEEEEELIGIERNPEIIPISGSISGEQNFEIGKHNEIETISEKEIRIRAKIKRHLDQYCKGSVENIKSINKELKQRFGKSRTELYLPELEKLLEYVTKIYPLYTKNNSGKQIKKGVSPYNPKNNREGVWSY